MGPLEIILIVVGSLLLLLLLLCFVGGFYVHKMMFGHRFKLDPLQGVYTKEILGLDAKPVEFYAKKNKLRGFLYSKQGYKENVIVVYCHGMWACHNSYLQNIGYLADKGYQVLGFDYIGTESSEGKNLGGFGTSLKSLDYAIKFIKNDEELKNKDIYVVGHSWGGFATSNIAALHPDIKGVVPMSPVIGVSELTKGLLPKWMGFMAYLFKFIDSLKCGKYSYFNAIKSLNNYKGKVLFIHSIDDEMVKIDYSTNLVKEKCKNKKIEYYIVEGKRHQPHYTLDACEKMYAFNSKIKGLSKEEVDNIKRETDFLAMGVIDPTVMDKVVELIEK